MNLLANENFPKASVLLLCTLGYDVLYIAETNFGIADEIVLRIAAEENRLIVTFDRDYGELIFKHNHKPAAGVLYLRLDEFTPEEPAILLHQLFTSEGFETKCRLTVFDGERVRQRLY